ncbi:hypothetical protein RND71_024525 [Anisodus tanguticus]|uniref:NADP-dependent oxidoreductase domain-containing protein n=1 Tax=Anisodus tanguticus TaxID=243964 RepID=A0AAE1VBS3_9SOLA|nr:hypothetical protein RND71_024525 [Anisodus tanguticus]
MENNPQIQIPRVKLGTQGLEVSKLGFGCGGLSGILNASLSHEAVCVILKEAFDKGITFFDTANVYGHEGHNEIMVGKVVKQLPREQVQLATKFGCIFLRTSMTSSAKSKALHDMCGNAVKKVSSVLTWTTSIYIIHTGQTQLCQ